MAHLMIEETRPFTRRAVAIFACQIGTITPSTSAVVMSLTGLRPTLGNAYRFSDERQTSADATAAGAPCRLVEPDHLLGGLLERRYPRSFPAGRVLVDRPCIPQRLRSRLRQRHDGITPQAQVGWLAVDAEPLAPRIR